MNPIEALKKALSSKPIHYEKAKEGSGRDRMKTPISPANKATGDAMKKSYQEKYGSYKPMKAPQVMEIKKRILPYISR